MCERECVRACVRACVCVCVCGGVSLQLLNKAERRVLHLHGDRILAGQSEQLAPYLGREPRERGFRGAPKHERPFEKLE